MDNEAELLKQNDYVISPFPSDNSKVVTFESSEEFLKWVMEEKPFKKRVGFLGLSKEIGKMNAMYSFLKYYYEIKEKCEKKMTFYNDLFSEEDNKFLKEAMDQFVSSNRGGKYLRATLVALGYQSFGKQDDDYISLALALEIFQTSILIHDDIIDLADKRRGMDTIPVKYKKIYDSPIKDNNSFIEKRQNVANSMALCLGDIGFYLANQVIVKNYFNNPKLPYLLEYYNEVAIKTCKGEMIDVTLPFYEEFYGFEEELEDQIIEIYKLKTSWYSVIGPYVLGSILAGIDKGDVHKLEDALINLGVAFQIKDDLLGIYGDENKIGKSAFSDSEEFKQTLLYSYTINTPYKDDLLKLYGKKNISNEELEQIRCIFDESGAKKYSLGMMEKLFKESFEDIVNLNILDVEKKKILLGFVEYLNARSK